MNETIKPPRYIKMPRHLHKPLGVPAQPCPFPGCGTTRAAPRSKHSTLCPRRTRKGKGDPRRGNPKRRFSDVMAEAWDDAVARGCRDADLAEALAGATPGTHDFTPTRGVRRVGPLAYAAWSAALARGCAGGDMAEALKAAMTKSLKTKAE